MADDKKFAGYICTGCGIGDRLDAGRLETVATREGKMHLCRQHEMLCSTDGVRLIRDDIHKEGVTHVMIAACSRRAKVEAFDFTDLALSRANLREGVIWLRPDTEEHRETTQEMADDYVRMACAEVRFMDQPAPSGEQELNKHILVVGGGVSGLSAALEAAAAGYPVSLVEKSGELGGHAAKLYRKTPSRSPYAQLEDTGVADLIRRIEDSDRIRVHLNSSITRTSGAPGRFSAAITTQSSPTRTESFGAIIQASGFLPYDAGRLPELGYGKTPDVVTNLELEELAREAAGAPIRRPSDGKEVSNVAFVQCAGQRSGRAGHLPYCSGFCCSGSIKQALYFKEQNPDCDTTILYTDLRTPGAAGEDFYRHGQQQGVMFTRSVVSEVIPGSSPRVRCKDLILDEEVENEFDLVVLATGMVANTGPDPYAQTALEEAGNEEERAAARARLENAAPSILNLDYRQGTDLPHLRHGFADSHFVCFPYETRRTGIYAAGPVRRPMDISQARDDAAGAALKAIQAAVNAAGGSGVHPRAGDLSFPKFRKEGCTQCKRCTVECPFGAIDEDEKRYPVFNESRCRRCGTCMGACPVRVISFDNYSIDTVGQQIKNCDIPDELEEKPRILVLACENDAYPALDQAAMSGKELSPWARVIPVRCLGSVSMSWITESMSNGYDGVVLMGCRRDSDYQCHFVKGSALTAERLRSVGDTLEQLSLEPERVAVHDVAITDIDRAPRLVNEMAAKVEELGMSPFKF